MEKGQGGKGEGGIPKVGNEGGRRRGREGEGAHIISLGRGRAAAASSILRENKKYGEGGNKENIDGWMSRRKVSRGSSPVYDAPSTSKPVLTLGILVSLLGF